MNNIHENSRQSHYEHENAGQGKTYRQKIMTVLAGAGEGMTDRQIITILNVKDVNNIRPEITRLKQADLIVECGKIKCPVTGKTVRTVRKAGFRKLLF